MPSAGLWLLVCVAVLLVKAAASEQWHVVDQTVCSFTPRNSPDPTSVECDLNGQSINVKSGNLLSTIQELQITNADIIDVQQGALSHLKDLQKVQLSDAERLLMRKNNMTVDSQADSISVTIDRIRDVTLFTGAFSGWRHESLNVSVTRVKTCNVSVTRVKTCTIAESAFPTNSVMSNVVLNDISNANLDRASFGATIHELALSNISSSYTCLADTFSGQIGRLSLVSVMLDRVDPGCFRASHPWQSLVINSSQFGDIPEHGFQGAIEHVQIENSNFEKIATRGFGLNVSSFSMETSVVDEMAGDALEVHASQSISISMSNFTLLHENTFRGLQVHNVSDQRITISHLAVENATVGSLTFTNWSAVTLHNILLGTPCHCNDTQFAAQLAFGAERTLSNLTENEQRTLHQVVFNSRCIDVSSTPALVEFVCTARCAEDAAGGGAGGGVLMWCPAQDRPAGSRAWLLWPLAFILLLLLLTAGCGPLLIARRCKRPSKWHRSFHDFRPGSAGPSREGGVGPSRNGGAGSSGDEDAGSSCEGGAGYSREGGVRSSREGEAGSSRDEGAGSLRDEAALGAAQRRESALKGRHVSWKVVEELDPDYDEVLLSDIPETEPDYDDVLTIGRPASATEPDYAEVLTTERPGPVTESDSCDVFESSRPASQTVSELYAEISEMSQTPEEHYTSGHQCRPKAAEALYEEIPSHGILSSGFETSPQPDRDNRLPVYAQVHKIMSASGESEADLQSRPAKGSPSPAEVKTSEPLVKNSGTDQQSGSVAELPMKTEVSKNARSPSSDTSEGSHQTTTWSTKELSTDEVSGAGRVTDAAAGSRHQTEPPMEFPVYAEVSSRDSPSETRSETARQSGALIDNELYGVLM